MLANCCKTKLNLKNAKLSPEYYYQSLSLCVIDAVFSIGIRYYTTRKVVINFCNALGIKRLRVHGSAFPPTKEQFSIVDFLNLFEKHGIGKITQTYFKNRCRTSSRNGILKSEAVRRFSEVLMKYRVNYFQDLAHLIGDVDFGYAIKQIPGQGSGLSTSYFYMLAGDEGFIKPDRMISRFIEKCVGITGVKTDEATDLVKEAHQILKHEFPDLTLRQLDHEIWKYQKSV